MARGFVLGLLTTLILLAIGGYLFVSTGALPAGQDVTPSCLEKWAAHTSLRATVRREARTLSSPLQPNEENLTAGIALYPDAIASSIAKGLSPAGPQLAKFEALRGAPS